jgi:hypothetical protein
MKRPPEKLKQWIRQILGPEKRELEEREAEQIYLILLLTVPYKLCNNQQTETHYYDHCGRGYTVTYVLGNKPFVEEVIK